MKIVSSGTSIQPHHKEKIQTIQISPEICPRCHETLNRTKFCIFCGQKIDPTAIDFVSRLSNRPKQSPMEYNMSNIDMKILNLVEKGKMSLNPALLDKLSISIKSEKKEMLINKDERKMTNLIANHLRKSNKEHIETQLTQLNHSGFLPTNIATKNCSRKKLDPLTRTLTSSSTISFDSPSFRTTVLGVKEADSLLLSEKREEAQSHTQGSFLAQRDFSRPSLLSPNIKPLQSTSRSTALKTLLPPKTTEREGTGGYLDEVGSIMNLYRQYKQREEAYRGVDIIVRESREGEEGRVSIHGDRTEKEINRKELEGVECSPDFILGSIIEEKGDTEEQEGEDREGEGEGGLRKDLTRGKEGKEDGGDGGVFFWGTGKHTEDFFVSTLPDPSHSSSSLSPLSSSSSSVPLLWTDILLQTKDTSQSQEEEEAERAARERQEMENEKSVKEKEDSKLDSSLSSASSFLSTNPSDLLYSSSSTHLFPSNRTKDIPLGSASPPHLPPHPGHKHSSIISRLLRSSLSRLAQALKEGDLSFSHDPLDWNKPEIRESKKFRLYTSYTLLPEDYEGETCQRRRKGFFSPLHVLQDKLVLLSSALRESASVEESVQKEYKSFQSAASLARSQAAFQVATPLEKSVRIQQHYQERVEKNNIERERKEGLLASFQAQVDSQWDSSSPQDPLSQHNLRVQIEHLRGQLMRLKTQREGLEREGLEREEAVGREVREAQARESVLLLHIQSEEASLLSQLSSLLPLHQTRQREVGAGRLRLVACLQDTAARIIQRGVRSTIFPFNRLPIKQKYARMRSKGLFQSLALRTVQKTTNELLFSKHTSAN